MPAIIAVLIGALISAIGSFVVQILIGLAFGVITYTGSQFALNWFLNGFLGQFNGLPSELGGVVAMLGIGNAASIIMSAVTVRLVIQGLNMASGKMSSLRMIGK